jgi:hypothetical protein
MLQGDPNVMSQEPSPPHFIFYLRTLLQYTADVVVVFGSISSSSSSSSSAIAN